MSGNSATHGLPSAGLNPSQLHPADPASTEHKHDDTVSAQSIEQAARTSAASPQPRAPVNVDSPAQSYQPPNQQSNNRPSLMRQYTEDGDQPTDDMTNTSTTVDSSSVFPSAVLPPQAVDKVMEKITEPHPVGADVEPSSVGQKQ